MEVYKIAAVLGFLFHAFFAKNHTISQGSEPFQYSSFGIDKISVNICLISGEVTIYGSYSEQNTTSSHRFTKKLDENTTECFIAHINQTEYNCSCMGNSTSDSDALGIFILITSSMNSSFSIENITNIEGMLHS